MNKYFKHSAVITAISLTAGLFACEKNQDVVPTSTPGQASREAQASLIIVKSRLTKVGKTVLTYGANGKIEKADDQHHRIQYTYPAGNQILVSHFYENNLAWTNLITLDGNGRAGTSKSTDLSVTKKYALDERVLNYTYTNGRLVSIKPALASRADLSEYKFTWNPDNDPTYAGDLKLISTKNSIGTEKLSAKFAYGYYVQDDKFTHTIPFLNNSVNVNQALHLGQWGAEPLADLIDFFLPIYGTTSTHLLNGVVAYSSGDGTVTESHYYSYVLTPNGYIDTAYTMGESTTPYIYQLIK